MKRLLCFLVGIACFLSFVKEIPAKEALTLTLQDAIALAVRDNPNVQQTKLSYLSQKYHLYVEHWEFYPHYAFQATATRGQDGIDNDVFTGSNNYTIQPGASLVTPIGTKVALTSMNIQAGNFKPGLSLQVLQPLMRGFGKAVVEAALNDAKDSEKTSRLSIEGTLRGTVTAVINAYLDVVNAERTVVIDQEALKRAEKSVQQTTLYIKAGHLPGNELITVRANVASAKTQLENDKNNLLQSRYALLKAIGVDPDIPVTFSALDVATLIKAYSLPPIQRVKTLTLENDTQYQTDQILLSGSTSRALLIAKDNARPRLDVTATASAGSRESNNTRLRNLFNKDNQEESIVVALEVPINDQAAKAAIVNAEIAIKNAKIGLKQEKWEKETNAINGWNRVVSAKRAYAYATDAEQLQEKTYNVSYKKYLHGLIDGLELQTAQLQLIDAQQTLLSAKLTYLKALVDLDFLTGQTLKTWNVEVRL